MKQAIAAILLSVVIIGGAICIGQLGEGDLANNPDMTYEKHFIYEICYKDKCRQTKHSMIANDITKCIQGGGGYACLDIVLK